MANRKSKSPLSRARKEEIKEIIGQKLHKHVYPFTVVLLDETSNEISSGTLIEICDRVFVATSAHGIPPFATDNLQILPDKPRPKSLGILRPSSARKHPDLDIAFLELPAVAATEYFQGKVTCNPDRIANLGSGSPSQVMILIGSPVQFVDVNKNKNGPPFCAKVTAFASPVIGKNKFPRLFVGHRVDPNTDVLMSYPESGVIQLDTKEPIALETPHGFSGGGMWSAGISPKDIWAPEHGKLFAIEIEWDKDLRIVRGIQIMHWLNLLRSRVPEIRECIEELFPQLMKMPTVGGKRKRTSNRKTTKKGRRGR